MNASKVRSIHDALAPIRDGHAVMVGGFGGAGTPVQLREALAELQLRQLTLIANNADFGSFTYESGLRRLICSYPVGGSVKLVIEGIEAGDIELTLTPQGTLAERLHAGGAGLGGVLTKTGLDTEFGAAFRQIELDGERWLLAPPLRADAALVKGAVADEFGNIVGNGAGRNFNPLMAAAADHVVAQVERVVGTGEIDPNHVHIPGCYVDAIVIMSETDE